MSLATVFALVILLFDLNRDGERCQQECYGTYRTYELGHAWTNYSDSWQWDAQNAIVGVAFVFAVVAFLYMLASRLQRAVVLTGISLLLIASWFVWIELQPNIG